MNEKHKRNKRIVIGCSIVAAICLGIVSYGDFYQESFERGCFFAVLTLLQFDIAANNYIALKNK